MARPTGEWSPPKTATTPSRSMTSRAAVTPLAGLPSSSRVTSSTFRPPSRPPRALISSMATVSPRLIASPESAEPPDRAATRATLIGGLAWVQAVVAGRARPTASSNASASRDERRIMTSSEARRERGLGSTPSWPSLYTAATGLARRPGGEGGPLVGPGRIGVYWRRSSDARVRLWNGTADRRRPRLPWLPVPGGRGRALREPVPAGLGRGRRTAASGVRGDARQRHAGNAAVRHAASVSPGHRAGRRFRRRLALGRRSPGISSPPASERRLPDRTVADRGDDRVLGLLPQRQHG